MRITINKLTFEQDSLVFANFLSATVKLRVSFSSAGEQFQANRQLSVALKPAVQRRKICKNENNIVKENHARKGTRPCEGVEGGGENRNSPPLFAILAFKMAKGLLDPEEIVCKSCSVARVCVYAQS